MSACVCPYCSKSGRVTAELVAVKISDDIDDKDHVSVEIEPEQDETQEQQREEEEEDTKEEEQSPENDEPKVETTLEAEVSQDIKNVFHELDTALEEIDDVVIEMINNAKEDETENPETVENPGGLSFGE